MAPPAGCRRIRLPSLGRWHAPHITIILSGRVRAGASMPNKKPLRSHLSNGTKGSVGALRGSTHVPRGRRRAPRKAPRTSARSHCRPLTGPSAAPYSRHDVMSAGLGTGLAGGIRHNACRGRLSASDRPSLSAPCGYSSHSLPCSLAGYHETPRCANRVSGVGRDPASYNSLASVDALAG